MAMDVTLAQAAMAARASRLSPEITVLDTDGTIAVVWNTTIADRQDPTRESAVAIEASPDTWQTIVPWGGMTTRGSTTRTDFTVIPHVVVAAPPSGWKVRARLTAGDQPITCGILVRSLTGIRRLPPAADAHHSVAYVTGQSVSGASGASLTTPSFTVSGSNRCLIAGVTDDQSGGTLTSCSGAGATWASLGQAVYVGSRAAFQWKGLAPSTGSQTATATWDNSDNNEQTLGVAQFEGVDQTTPTSDTTSNTGSSTAVTVTVPNVTTGDYVMDCATGLFNTVDPYGVGADQTAVWVFNVTEGKGAGSIQPGSAGGVMSWTLGESSDWGTVATRIRQAAGAAGTPLTAVIAEQQV